MRPIAVFKGNFEIKKKIRFLDFINSRPVPIACLRIGKRESQIPHPQIVTAENRRQEVVYSMAE